MHPQIRKTRQNQLHFVVGLRDRIYRIFHVFLDPREPKRKKKSKREINPNSGAKIRKPITHRAVSSVFHAMH